MTFHPRRLGRSAAGILVVFAAASSAEAQIQVRATHPNGEVSIVVNFEVKPGFEGEFETAFARSTRCARLDSGNIVFNVHKVIGADGRYVAYNIWRSEAAFRSHLERPYTKALFVMQGRALVRPISEGGLRLIGDLEPAPRLAPRTGDPSDDAACR